MQGAGKPVTCAKLLESLTTDRGATLRLYPAIKRSVVCAADPALSFAKPPSDKDQDKRNASRLRADLAQLISRVFVDRRCSSCLLAGRGQNAGASAVAPVVSNSSVARSQADRSQSDVIMSGIVDSGR